MIHQFVRQLRPVQHPHLTLLSAAFTAGDAIGVHCLKPKAHCITGSLKYLPDIRLALSFK